MSKAFRAARDILAVIAAGWIASHWSDGTELTIWFLGSGLVLVDMVGTKEKAPPSRS